MTDAPSGAGPPVTARSLAIGAALLAGAVQVAAIVAWRLTEGSCVARPTGLTWSHGTLADSLALAGGFAAPVVALIALPWLVRRRPGRRWVAISARVAVALSLPLAFYLLGTAFGESFFAC